MSDRQSGSGHDPERLFHELKDRPTPELDSDRLWQQVASKLTPRRARWWQMGPSSGAGRPVFARLGYAVAGIVVLALATWAGFALLGGGQPAVPGEAGLLAEDPGTEAAEEPTLGARIVRLAPELPDIPAVTVDEHEERGAVNLQVRLVRGYSGPVPADVEAVSPLAAGGADALADVRPEVASLPFEEYGMVGRWEGEISAIQSIEAGLSGDYTLSFATAENVLSGNYVELTDVHLVGEIDVLVASSLRLEPGRLHLLGVKGPGEEAPSIILAIKVEAASDTPGTESSIR
jgi:hypothetical protein